MAGKRVVVVGGGIGGLIAANRLRRLLNREHNVVVVDRSSHYYFSPSLLWLVLGSRTPSGISQEIPELLHKGVEFIQEEVTAIDVEKRQVVTTQTELPFDHLLVALGSGRAPEAVPGLAEAAHGFYDLESAQRLAEALPGFQRGAVAVVISSMPFKCPAAPYEGALLIDYMLRKQGLRDGVSINMYTPEPAPLPVAGERIGDAVKGMLAQRDIPYHAQTRLASVDPQAKELTFEGGEKAQFDLLVAIPPHRSPEVVRASTLANEAGWIPVNPRTLETGADGIYVIGDVTSVTTPSGLPLPKAGVFAHREAEVVARRIAAQVEGHAASTEYEGHGSCFIEMGYSKAAFATGNFYAEPKPAVAMRGPGRLWHWGKVLFEKRWLRGWV